MCIFFSWLEVGGAIMLFHFRRPDGFSRPLAKRTMVIAGKGRHRLRERAVTASTCPFCARRAGGRPAATSQRHRTAEGRAARGSPVEASFRNTVAFGRRKGQDSASSLLWRNLFLPATPMPSPQPAAVSASLAKPNPVLCASGASRLLWAAGALVILWTTVLWALD
jgi:hypothetical protein